MAAYWSETFRELDVKVLRFVHQVCPVLVDVAGVDDEEVLALFKAVQVRVVNGVSVRVRDDAVLRLIEVERKHVAGKHMLQEGDLIGASTSIRPMWTRQRCRSDGGSRDALR